MIEHGSTEEQDDGRIETGVGGWQAVTVLSNTCDTEVHCLNAC